MILLIAWINYVNLETSRMITRIKEVGVRRIVGSSRKELILQFFIQYLCINTLATVMASLMVYLLLPYFQEVTGVPIQMVQLSMPLLWWISLGIFLTGTVVTGIYPALFLLKYNPIDSLKGKLASTSRGILLRKSLLTFQIVSSLTLMAFLMVAAVKPSLQLPMNRSFS